MNIRRIENKDFKEVENVIREAFWNVYMPGCDEHLIIHKLKDDKCFVNDLSIVIEEDNKIIGAIFYALGKLKNEDIECSFGFDTATKVYSELIGNIERDANSAKKYWHFIKVMGRSASHIALECALQTQPNICLISEEVSKKKMSLKEIVDYITDSIVKRSEKNMDFGVVIIPEGIIGFVPEISILINEINELLTSKKVNKIPSLEKQCEYIINNLTKESKKVLEILPKDIQEQLFLERDPHGNVQVSHIESEKLLSAMVKERLSTKKSEGIYKGKFSPVHHFLGYEGRCAFPSNFDADYCYSLGYNSFMLIQFGYNGYLSKISNLSKPAVEWIAGGMPITKMMNIERRHGEEKPVIKKALVDLTGKPFKYFEENRENWAIETLYIYPGAIQYYGPSEICDNTTITLALEKK
jgi:pyrophosphate--fructose-6-phosphate 1-phosphotransferase